MQPSLDTKVAVPPELESLFRHLAHELRQPLSGIESIAYYLDMVLGECEPEIQQQCERLRRMVQQAHWILEDAALTMRLAEKSSPRTDFVSVFTQLGSELALHEDCNLEIRCACQLPVAIAPAGLARRCSSHILNFFRSVALAQDPIRVTLSFAEPFVDVSIEAVVLADTNDLLRLLNPPQQSSGIRRFMDSCGGSVQFYCDGSALRTSMRFPAATE